MFLRFKEACIDSKTNVRYAEGQIKEFPDDRAEEILAVEGGRYAEAVELKVISPKKGKEIAEKKAKEGKLKDVNSGNGTE